jgi:hypothetical protein
MSVQKIGCVAQELEAQALFLGRSSEAPFAVLDDGYLRCRFEGVQRGCAFGRKANEGLAHGVGQVQGYPVRITAVPQLIE